jgi:glycosyltransferase involved in cell wall biosynthesis
MIADLVSTIIPVFNRPVMLREAVASVFAQSWRQIEIIIVDDASTDTTLAVANELAEQNPNLIRVLQQSNAGPGVARQRGLEVARGEFVQFLDSDDLLLPEKFALQIAALRADPDAHICYGKTYSSTDGIRDSMPAQRTGEMFRTLFPSLLDEPLWPTMTPLYRRQFLELVGPWPRTRQLEDWVYDAQAGSLNAQLRYVDEFVAETRNHSGARLCGLWQDDDGAFRERVSAYFTVLACARTANVSPSCRELPRFARALFWMAREAGRRGLEQEADELLRLAKSVPRARTTDMRLFGIVARLVGWRRAAHWSGRR